MSKDIEKKPKFGSEELQSMYKDLRKRNREAASAENRGLREHGRQRQIQQQINTLENENKKLEKVIADGERGLDSYDEIRKITVKVTTKFLDEGITNLLAQSAGFFQTEKEAKGTEESKRIYTALNIIKALKESKIDKKQPLTPEEFMTLSEAGEEVRDAAYAYVNVKKSKFNRRSKTGKARLAAANNILKNCSSLKHYMTEESKMIPIAEKNGDARNQIFDNNEKIDALKKHASNKTAVNFKGLENQFGHKNLSRSNTMIRTRPTQKKAISL